MADSPFIGPSYPLASKPTSVQRTVNLMPRAVEPGNERSSWVFQDVPGLVAVSTTNYIPPHVPTVISQLDFHQSKVLGTYSGGAPNTATVAITEDYIAGVNWTLIGHEQAVATTGSGVLYFEEYQAVHAFSNSCMQSNTIAGMAALDDFTLEFSHDENGCAIYNTVQYAMLVTGVYSNFGAANLNTEWLLQSRHDTLTGNRYLEFRIVNNYGGGVPAVIVATAPATFPIAGGAGVVREIAVTRTSGIIRIFVNGVLAATQDTIIYPADHTALYPVVTFGAISNGVYYIPNNYGEGKYSRWRLTAESRYTTSYTPTGSPFPAP